MKSVPQRPPRARADSRRPGAPQTTPYVFLSPPDRPMIQLTPSAISHLKSISQEGESGTGLRLAVERGGCAGMQYIMRLDTPKVDDLQVTSDGALVMVDPESLIFISGSTLDYTESLNDSGFKVINPRAARTCGCGTSFETAEH